MVTSKCFSSSKKFLYLNKDITVFTFKVLNLYRIIFWYGSLLSFTYDSQFNLDNLAFFQSIWYAHARLIIGIGKDASFTMRTAMLSCIRNCEIRPIRQFSIIYQKIGCGWRSICWRKRNNQLVDFKNGCCNNGEFGVLLFLAIIYLHFVPLLEPIRYMRKLTEEFIATNRWFTQANISNHWN